MLGSALTVTALPSTANLMLAMKPPFGCAALLESGRSICATSLDPGQCRRNAMAEIAAVVRYAVGEEEPKAVKTGARETGIDLQRFRLRRFVEELRQTGELEVRAGPPISRM